MPENHWTPECPYCIQSGKHAGFTLEHLLISDIVTILNMKWAFEHGSNTSFPTNGYQRHFQWLIEQTKKLHLGLICQECGQTIAEIIPILGSKEEGYTIVNKAICHQCGESGEWYNKIKLSLSPWELSYFRSKADKIRAWRIVKNLLGIKKLTDQELFKLLKTL
jgi:hypothetical protein